MNYYAIPPFPNLLEYKDHPYFMVIAPLVKQYPELWSFYKGKKTIIDNGEFEGCRCDIHELLDIAQKINANEVVLPDKMGDPEQTAHLISDALPLVRSKGFRTMGVAHGSNIYEVAKSAKRLKYGLEVDTVAIPRYVAQMDGYTGRMQVSQLLPFNTHYLGLVNPFELSCVQPRSIDTSFPFKVKQLGGSMNRPCAGKLDFEQPTEARKEFEQFKKMLL